ncbi:hypothetical protein [Floridanema evergladense]|uniref:HEAT repeat domain-containing protein n=1 Tax=Floridaenema evergladense BLCC-F167 TaxID=3153639 RepID=A0ABV4WI92_9CYAN
MSTNHDRQYAKTLAAQLRDLTHPPAEIWLKLREYGSVGWAEVDAVFDRLDPAWQYGLIELWGDRSEPPLPVEAAKRLTQLVEGEDITLAHPAAVALARLGEPHTTIALQRLIADLDNPVEMRVDSAAIALRNLGMPLAAPAIPALERVVMRPRVRGGLLSSLVYQPRSPSETAKQVLKELREYLSKND